MAQVRYRIQGAQVRFSDDACKLRLAGYWIMAANRTVTLAQFEQLVRDNPAVAFVADRSEDSPDVQSATA